MTHDNRKLPPTEGSGSQLRAPVSKSDSAFKIRMELLHLAKARLTEEYNTDMIVAVEKSKCHGSTKPFEELGKFPSVDQILDEARKLKEFIDKG